MQCPVCHLDQVIVEYHDVELDLCIDGCGLWFDKDELRQLFELAGAPGGLHDFEERLVEVSGGEHGPPRRCPRCRGKMRHVSVPGGETPPESAVILDRCRRGHGLWFDKGELEAILQSSLGDEDAPLAAVKEFLGRFVPEQAEPETDPASNASQPSGGSEAP